VGIRKSINEPKKQFGGADMNPQKPDSRVNAFESLLSKKAQIFSVKMSIVVVKKNKNAQPAKQNEQHKNA
jgi:hypothetical protein